MRPAFIPTVVLAIATVAAGCGGAGKPSAHRAEVAKPVRMVATPVAALALCERLALVRASCPGRVPLGRYRDAKRPPGFRGPYAAGAIAVCEGGGTRGLRGGGAGCRSQSWMLEAGAPAGLPPDAPPGIPGKRLGPARTRPPRYVHLILDATRGSLAHSFAFAWPHGRARPVTDSLLDPKRSAPIFLGRRTWAGHRGTLVLAPPLVFGGVDGDHLIFRWSHGAIDRAVSMHSWAPLAEAVATLHAVIDSEARS